MAVRRSRRHRLDHLLTLSKLARIQFGRAVLSYTLRSATALPLGHPDSRTSSDGQKTTITADTGTLSPGSVEDAADANSVKLILHDAYGETLAPTDKKVTTIKEMTLVLKR